jgi:CheY-like chemotaxis protein
MHDEAKRLAAIVEASTTVLLVDDDEVFRRSTARILTAHGYSCVEAATSAQARVVLDTEPDVAAVL